MQNRRTSFWLGFILLATFLLPCSAFSADRYVYVADQADSLVTIIDLQDNSIVAQVDLGIDVGPQNLILHPTRPYLYVSNYTEGTVSAIDIGNPAAPTPIDMAPTDPETNNLSVGLNPQGISFSPDGKKLYVAHGIDEDFTGVWKQYLTEVNVDDTSGADYHTISRSKQFSQNVVSDPYAMKVREVGGRLQAYISGRLADYVYIVDIENLYFEDNNGTPEDPTDDPTPPAYLTAIALPTDSLPHGLAVSNSGVVYVTCQGSDQLAVITSPAVIDYVAVGANPTDVALFGDTAYVVNTGDSTLSVIDITTKSPLHAPIAVGGDPTAAPEYVSISADGLLAYVTGKDDDSLTLINTVNYATEWFSVTQEGGIDWGAQGVASLESGSFLSLVPAEKNFGSVGVSGENTEAFTVTNKGIAPLQISAISAPVSDYFSIATDDCTGSTLQYTNTCSFSVTFAPTLPGYATDQLVITSDASNAAADGTLKINLAGTGTTASTITAPKTTSTGAQVNGTSVTFTWENAVDPAVRELTYLVQIATNTQMSENLQVFKCTNAGVMLAGTGLMTLLMLGGALRKKSGKMLVVASVFALTAVLTACGGGGGGGGGDVGGGGGGGPIVGVPSANTTTSEAVSGLAAGTYYWRVLAQTTDGETSNFSNVSSFTIQ